ncbi:helix-turn-helix domain-containing protein [Actinokineospora sp. 24-640]
MPGQRNVLSAADVARAVGQEIRRARSAIGWTRAELVERLDSDLHVQTVAGYEQGIRHCTVARLVEISRALGSSAPELLALALQRAEIDLDHTGVRVDLHAIARDQRAELTPLRVWAQHRLEHDAENSGVATLEPAVVENMAHFCQLPKTDMLTLLVDFTPDPVTRPR